MISVATWNVNGRKPDSGLHALNADVILAQELRGTPVGYRAVRPDLDGRPWGSAVLSRPLTLEVATDVRTPDAAGWTARVAAASTELLDGSRLTVVSCHVPFDAADSDYSVTSLLRLIASLIPTIDAVAKPTARRHIVIGGDLNVDAAMWGTRHAAVLGLFDTWGLVDLAARRGVLEPTWPVEGHGNVKRPRRLDYLFASKTLAATEYSVRTRGWQESDWPSDHAAVVVEFSSLDCAT